MSKFDEHIEKAMEEVNIKNAKSIVEYSKQTRTLFRDTDKQVNELKAMVVQQNATIDELRKQLVNLLIKVGC